MGFFYNDGYLRTASKVFNINNCEDLSIHLTNDAVQKKQDDYGRFEQANKLSYNDFQRYLDVHYADKKVSVVRDILP